MTSKAHIQKRRNFAHFQSGQAVFTSEAGQAVLIVLLSLSVVLIIVLYIMSRSITDLSLSSKEEESLRAFSAAEAGIERSLLTLLDSGGPIDGALFDAKVSSFGQGEVSVVYPVSLKSGESAVFWFAPDPDVAGDIRFSGDQMTICWGDPETAVDSSAPAIEVAVYYGLSTSLNVARIAIDPFSAGRSNSFSAVDSGTCTIGSASFQFRKTINLTTTLGIADLTQLQYASVRILYNTSIAHKIGIDVTGFGLLPSQGNQVTSLGTFSGANRKIEVFETRKVAPPIFENVVFATNGIVK